MKKKSFLLVWTLLFIGIMTVQAQKNSDAFEPAHLKGIWQLYHYVSDQPEVPGVLKPSNTFKVLSDDGRIINFTIRPGYEAILTGYGTYRQLTNVLYKESIEKNIHLPMLDNKDNMIEFELVDDELLHLRYYIKKDLNGNELNTWYYETWKRVKMPAAFPEDMVR